MRELQILEEHKIFKENQIRNKQQILKELKNFQRSLNYE
jgi:hypothetical protein